MSILLLCKNYRFISLLCCPQLTTAQAAALKSTQLAALSTEQVAAFEAVDVAKLSAAALKGLGVDDMAALTTSAIHRARRQRGSVAGGLSLVVQVSVWQEVQAMGCVFRMCERIGNLQVG